MNDLSGPMILVLMSLPVLLLGHMRERPVLRTAAFLILLLPGFLISWEDARLPVSPAWASLAWEGAILLLSSAAILAIHLSVRRR